MRTAATVIVLFLLLVCVGAGVGEEKATREEAVKAKAAEKQTTQEKIAEKRAAGEEPAQEKTVEPLAKNLAPPVRILVDKEPIDVDAGHAAPFVGDFDGDGKMDLLVGQFGEGKLRVYRNVGSGTRPEFQRHEWFKAGADLGRVPVG